jgi:death on curing protein
MDRIFGQALHGRLSSLFWGPLLPAHLSVPEIAAELVLSPHTIKSRPQATAFGKDTHPSLDANAAALLHSMARSHALVDGNKRLALAAVIAFCGLNGRRLTLTNDQAYGLS